MEHRTVQFSSGETRGLLRRRAKVKRSIWREKGKSYQGIKFTFQGLTLFTKAVAEVKRGTGLVVLEDKGQWLRVGLEDGREGWIGKATTSENP